MFYNQICFVQYRSSPKQWWFYEVFISFMVHVDEVLQSGEVHQFTWVNESRLNSKFSLYRRLLFYRSKWWDGQVLVRSGSEPLSLIESVSRGYITTLINNQALMNSIIFPLIMINSFTTNALILHPLKITGSLWFSGVFKGYKMGILPERNRLTNSL